MNPWERQTLQSIVEKMLEMELIQHSKSPYSILVLLIQKKMVRGGRS